MKINLLDYYKKEELNLKNNLVRIGTYGKYSPLGLEFEIDKDWFYFIELLRTDGHISKDKVELKLVNTDKKLIDSFVNFLRGIGFTKIRYEINKNDYRARLFNKTFSDILSRVFNIKPGNKSLDTRLPEWMKTLNEEYTSSMLRGSFDGDGSVQNSIRSRTKRVRLNTGSKDYAEDVKYLLSRFNIPSAIFPDPRRQGRLFYVQISRKKDIFRFAELIGFKQEKRARILKDILTCYKWYTTEEVVENILNLVRTEKNLTCGKIAKKLNRTDSTISAHLKHLEQKRLIKKIKCKQSKIIMLT